MDLSHVEYLAAAGGGRCGSLLLGSLKVLQPNLGEGG